MAEIALIVPLSGSNFPGLPGVPTHPIAPGAPGSPEHPIHDPWPGRPSHPISLPPPGFWPPPPAPDQGLPTEPPQVDQGLPIVPDYPIYPDNSLPDGTAPLPPGMVWPPLPPNFNPPNLDGKVVALVVIFGVGYRWAVLDLSLVPPGKPTLPPKPVPPTP